jgi:uncharacterized membrane protein
MRTQRLEGSAAAAFGDRVDTVGWGLLFVVVGVVSLIPAMPDGAWLIGAGLVILLVSGARARLGLPIRGAAVAVGIVALSAGVFTIAHLDDAVGPFVLVVLGLSVIVGAIVRGREPADDVPLAAGHRGG